MGRMQVAFNNQLANVAAGSQALRDLALGQVGRRGTRIAILPVRLLAMRACAARSRPISGWAECVRGRTLPATGR